VAVLNIVGRRWLAAIAAVSILLPGRSTPAQGLEYEVKAAFLYNFVQFTTWPDAAFAAADEPFGVCVAGTDPFGPRLESTFAGETFGKHRMQIHRLQGTTTPPGRCHLLFVADDGTARLPALVKSHPYALLVGESPDFLLRGGIINFIVEAGRVRFDVNTGTAATRGLMLSSRLLRIARVADDPRGAQ
jgi:hypothetical protein